MQTLQRVVLGVISMSVDVDNLAERAIREHWEFAPTAGSRIGRHEYDGRLPDFSSGRVARRVEELHRSLAKLSSLPPEYANGADEDARMDRLSRSLLEMFLRRELFNLEEMQTLHNNPQRQVGYLGVGSYVQRDYAPLPDRLRSATAILRQAPDFLASWSRGITFANTAGRLSGRPGICDQPTPAPRGAS